MPTGVVRRNLEVLYVLVEKEIKVRYKSSIFGYLWAVTNPFAFALVYYVAFKFIMRVQMDNYSIFLLSALFPWLWATNSIIGATTSYRNNSSLVKRVMLWRGILPLSTVIHEMVHFGFALPVLILFILYNGGEWYFSWLYQIPMMIVLQFMMVYPLALLFALANVFVHDVEYLVNIAFSMLFFLTPIIYPLTMIPADYQLYFKLSPLTQLMEAWRSVFLEGVLLSYSMLYCFSFAVTVGLLAGYVYHRTQAKIGERL